MDHKVKIDQVSNPLFIQVKAATYDFGELTRQENPLRKLIVPIELLREFEDFEIRMGEMMERLNPSHNADYDRCMFCWLKNTTAAADPLLGDLMGRFLLFSQA